MLADPGATEALRAAADAERLRLLSADGSLSIAAADEARALSLPAPHGALALERKKD